MHRDLKLENILIADREWTASSMTVKLSDFGLSKELTECKESAMATFCGTLFYVAPEILRGDAYDEKVDCWSLGVIAYCLLCGSLPFYSENELEISKLILSGQYDLGQSDQHWRTVSDAAKHLVRNLLRMEPDRRLTAQQVLDHRFIAGPNTANVGRKRPSLKQVALKQFEGILCAAKQTLRSRRKSQAAD